MHFSATHLSVGPGIANCVHSGGRPQNDMFIVSYGPLGGGGPAYLQRCDVALADEYLSRFCIFFLLSYSSGGSPYIYIYIWKVFYIPFSFLACHMY
jgi:hypothetical protein